MLDTVIGSLQEYTLAAVNAFEFQPARVDCFGVEKSPGKQFANLPNLNIDIKPDGTLYYKASLPHLVYGSSIFELKDRDIELCIETLEKRLKATGLDFPKNELLERPLSRVDFCRNIQVDYAIPDYIYYFSQFRMSRRDTLNWKAETIYFRNRQKELAVYNKVRAIGSMAACKDERAFIAGMPENILRFESRFRTGKAIKSVVSNPTLANVFSFELCRSILLNDIDGLVSPKAFQLDLDFQENNRLLETIKRTQARNTFAKFLSVKGIDAFILEFRGDFSLMKEFLSVHYKRRQVYEILSQIKELQGLSMPKVERDLLAEIRLKLAA